MYQPTNPQLLHYEKKKKKRTMLEVKGHAWEIIKLVARYVSASSNFAAHCKLKQYNLNLSCQGWPRHTL